MKTASIDGRYAIASARGALGLGRARDARRTRRRAARERGASAAGDRRRARARETRARRGVGRTAARARRETGDRSARARSIRFARADALESFANRGDARGVRVRANELGRARDVAEWEE